MATKRQLAEQAIKALSIEGEEATDYAAANAAANRTGRGYVALLAAQLGTVAALLDIADAIREQTTGIREALLNEGVRTVEM